MDNLFYTPYQMLERNLKAAETKAKLSFSKMTLMGLMAGFFISFGATASSLASHAVENPGLAKTLAGAIFPIGLMLVILVGAELFTGNCLMIMAVMDKRITWQSMIRNLVLVYGSNLIGSLIVVFLVYGAGQFSFNNNALGAYTIKVAMGKTALTPLQQLCSGILCNMLVCLAIFMAGTAKDIEGKIWGAFFPIFTFVIGGFEHCVANMYYIPAGMLASHNAKYAEAAQALYGITAEQAAAAFSASGVLGSFVFVTLGNIIGGMVFVGVINYIIHKMDE